MSGDIPEPCLDPADGGVDENPRSRRPGPAERGQRGSLTELATDQLEVR